MTHSKFRFTRWGMDCYYDLFGMRYAVRNQLVYLAFPLYNVMCLDSADSAIRAQLWAGFPYCVCSTQALGRWARGNLSTSQ